MPDPRIPIQKRSIEKKQKILEAGFELFCEKGYYRTNTTEIAKRAGVSTGALYSYFSDKRQIYIAAFQGRIDGLSERLFEELESRSPCGLSAFVDNWIEAYLTLYAPFSRALSQLRRMLAEDEEINRHFAVAEQLYFEGLLELLRKNGLRPEHGIEKISLCCILIDALRQESALLSHSGLDFEVLKRQVREAVLALLSNKGTGTD